MAKSGRRGQMLITYNTTIGGAAPAAPTNQQLAELRTWSLDSSANTQTVDPASMNNFASWTETYTLSRSWSGSFNALWSSDQGQAFALVVGQTVSIKVYPDSVTGEVYSGTGVITQLAINSSYDGLVEFSITVGGTGALTVA